MCSRVPHLRWTLSALELLSWLERDGTNVPDDMQCSATSEWFGFGFDAVVDIDDARHTDGVVLTDEHLCWTSHAGTEERRRGEEEQHRVSL